MFYRTLTLCLSALLAGQPSFATTSEGGVNGGGGGTLPADPISIREAIRIIQEESKADLQAYIKYQQSRLGKRSSSLEKRVFGGQPNLWDVLHTTDIEIRSDRPCYNAFGAEVDASIHSDLPNAICLSVARVAPKLIFERAKSEISALILHELSHLLGANEAEAHDLQSEAAHYLNQQLTPHLSGEEFFIKLYEGTQEISWSFANLPNDFSKLTNQEMQSVLDTINTQIGLFFQASQVVGQSLFSDRERSYFFLQMSRLKLAGHFLLSQSGTRGADYWRQEYENNFSGSSSVSYDTFLAHYIGGGYLDWMGGHFPNEVIERLNSASEVENLLQASRTFFSAVEDFARSLRFGSRPNHLLESSLSTNPWISFVGEYVVTDKKCDGSASYATGFKIEYSAVDSNRLRLTEIWANGWGDKGGLYDGTNVFSAGDSVFIDGGTGWAGRVNEHGNRWGGTSGAVAWAQQTLRFEKSGNSIVVTEVHTSRRWKDGQFTDSTSTCTFQIEKK